MIARSGRRRHTAPCRILVVDCKPVPPAGGLQLGCQHERPNRDPVTSVVEMALDRTDLALNWHVRRIGYGLFHARRRPPSRVAQPFRNAAAFVVAVGIGKSPDSPVRAPAPTRIGI